MAASILEKITDDFSSGRELSVELAEPLLDALITEQDESLVAAVLRAWNQKGIEESEIYEFARILRSRMNRVNSRHASFVDIVGTGGSGAKTFNVSTAAAFVAAGCGMPVAKHGNKAATSNSGSADVLAELGIDSAVDPETAERNLNEVGICFMFAPNHHRLSATLAKVRRGLRFPTVFNCVGPLCNPASAPHQLIGVWERGLVPKMANALARLGTKRSWIVHGDGLDELTLAGATFVAEVDNEVVHTFEMSPEEFGMERSDLGSIRCRDSVDSAETIRKVLGGGLDDSSPAVRIVMLNAAAALFIGGQALEIGECVAMVRESVSTGAAKEKLELLARASEK